MKLSTPQQALLHALESIGISVVLSAVLAVYQFIATNGINAPGLAAFAGSTFLGALGMIYKSVSSNPNSGPAVIDTLKEVQQLAHSHPAPAPVPQPVQQFKPPVSQISQVMPAVPPMPQ